MSNLISLLEQHGVPFRQSGEDKHVSRKGWIGLHCPWCGGGSFHLGIQPSTGRCNCWRCGRRDPAVAISMLCNVSRREAASVISVRESPPPVHEHAGTLRKPSGLGPLQSVHRNYLSRRGFDPDEIEQLWGVQGIGVHARLSWRLFIPIYDEAGREVSWTTRAVSAAAEQRYLSASEEEESVPHKSLLYGAHLARHTIVIVEGPIDAWAIGPGAVATCGTGFSGDQLIAMLSYPMRVVCFDSTADAQRRAAELCQRLGIYSGVTENVVLETGSDAADADEVEIAELRDRYLLV